MSESTNPWEALERAVEQGRRYGRRADHFEERALAAEARIKAVLDVHEESAPINKVGWTYCRHCTAPTAKTYVLYPCPTIRALESVPPPSA